MDKQDTLRKALVNGVSVQLEYSGKLRTVEPHCLGESTVGNLVLRCYQTLPEPGWKLLIIKDIKKLKALKDKAQSPRPGYQENDRGMTIIHQQLKVS